MEHVPTPGLQADRDEAFAVRSGHVARLSRWGLAVVVGLAALGLFGGAGPLVPTTTARGGLTVRYDRFARLDAPLRLAITVPASDSAFWLTGDLGRDLQIESFSPSSVAESLAATGVRYRVASSGAVRIEARPSRFGVLDGAVALDGGERVDLRIVVYP